VISIDLSAYKRFIKDLGALKDRAIPYAVRDTLNDAAFAARAAWAERIRKDLTLRNSFTVRSLQVAKAGGTDIRVMRAVLGSRAPYMADVEQGQTQTAAGKHGVAIPTPSAAGQALKARLRTKPIRRANWLSAIHLQRGVTGSRQRRNAAAISMAVRAGGGFVYLDTGRRQGLFRVDGRKRGIKLRMLYDLSKRTVKSAPRPTLEQTVKLIGPRIPAMGERAIARQIKRAITGSTGRRSSFRPGPR
jgi:hypothetical protein